MPEQDVSLILRELDSMKLQNRQDLDELKNQNSKDHGSIQSGINHTNGTVGDLVAWRIKADFALKIIGWCLGGIIIPLTIYTVSLIIKQKFF